MRVKDLIDEVARRVPPGAPAGTRHRSEARVASAMGPLNIAVAMRMDAAGRVRQQFWCEGVRLQRHELLRLTCAEAACPQSIAVRQQWQVFQRRRAGRACIAPKAPRNGAAAQALMREEMVHVAGHTCAVRPATFRCFTRCPNAAHPPMWIDKSGFDIFEDGVCIAGGVTPADGGADWLDTTQPRIPTLVAAEAYVLSRSLEASSVMNRFVKRT